METEILKFIVNNHGAVNTADLLFNLCDASTLHEIISGNEKLVSCSFSGRPKVVARCPVRLCRVKDCVHCGDLHLCKNFLLSGVCRFSQRRRGCLFSHELTSGHNTRVLVRSGLETLTRPELCLLLLQSDSTLLPAICFDYNNGLGLNGQCTDSCHRLHICLKYLSGDCTCFRNHNFSDEQPIKILREKHIPEDLLHSLRSVYANKEALRMADKAGQTNRGSGGNVSRNLTKRAVSCGNLLAGVDSGLDELRPRGAKHSQRDKTEICMYFIKGHCKFEDQCFKAHDKMPYRWEIKHSGQWTPMADNEKIEKDYCDPQNTYSTTNPPVHFDTMLCGSDEVRRLSTVNSVLEPDFIHTTDWLWYWEDEFGKWYQYASITTEHRLASVTSEQLEEMFVKKEKDEVEFTAGSHRYSLSFQDLIQTNLKYGTKRLVRRRPQFVSAAEVQSKRKRPTNSTAVPDYWDKMQTLQTGYKRVSLQSSSEEYKEIQALFCQTMQSFNIVQIERIQNKALWEAFQLQKIHMKNNNGRKPVLEKKLFHGTNPKFVDTICATNFDWRVCGVNGTSYGQGSYFARDASYSHRYTGTADVHFMFVSRVLVGEFTKGSAEFRRPPSKDEGHVNLYDSCVNHVENPSIFVIFEKHQIYPEYLLQYEQKQQSVDPVLNEHARLRKLLAAVSSVKAADTNMDTVDSAFASNPTFSIATYTPKINTSLTKHTSLINSSTDKHPGLIKQVIHEKPATRAEDWLTLELALSRRKHLDACASNTKPSFPNTAFEDSASVPKPSLSTVKQQSLSKPVIYPKPQEPIIGFTNTSQNLVTRRINLLEAPIPAAVPRPTLTPTLAPKPVVIPSCFTETTSSSASSSRSVGLVSSSRSSTPASYAYMLDCLKKM